MDPAKIFSLVSSIIKSEDLYLIINHGQAKISIIEVQIKRNTPHDYKSQR